MEVRVQITAPLNFHDVLCLEPQEIPAEGDRPAFSVLRVKSRNAPDAYFYLRPGEADSLATKFAELRGSICDTCGQFDRPVRYTSQLDGWPEHQQPRICRACFEKWEQPDFCGSPAELEWTDLEEVK